MGKDLRLLLARDAADEPGRCLDCGATTRYRKPYCREHVERNLYVQGMLRRMARMEREARAVLLAARRARPRDLLAGEVLCCLETGPLSVEALVDELGLPSEVPWARARVVRAYVQCLLEARRVALKIEAGQLVVVRVAQAKPARPLLKVIRSG